MLVQLELENVLEDRVVIVQIELNSRNPGNEADVILSLAVHILLDEVYGEMGLEEEMDDVAEQQLPDGEHPLEEGCYLLHPGPGVRHPELVARRQVADLEVGEGGAEHTLEVVPVTEAPAIKHVHVICSNIQHAKDCKYLFERCYKTIVVGHLVT